MAGWIKMPLATELCVGPVDFVLDEDPASPKGGGATLQFSAHGHCGQRTGWIKMPLCTEVNLGPGGVATPPPLKGHSSQLSVYVYIVAKRLDGWRRHLVWSRPGPRPRCIRRGPGSPWKGHSSSSLFSAHVYCDHGRPSQLLLIFVN